MKHTIEVKDIQLYAFHGCLPEEEKIGGLYSVDVKIVTDFTKSIQTDELEDTVDYVAINSIVKKEMEIRSKLIEHVAHRIYKNIHHNLNNIIACSVTVIKHTPPIGGNVKDVRVTIED